MPSLVVLPLAINGIPGADLTKIFGILVGGMVASLVVTAQVRCPTLPSVPCVLKGGLCLPTADRRAGRGRPATKQKRRYQKEFVENSRPSTEE